MKRCPVCKTNTLSPATLQDGLPAHRCERCQGVWISSNPYLAWLKTHGPDLPEKAARTDLPTWDTRELKLCPDCSRIITRYRVLPDQKFYLDHCNHCNGVWLDKDEWTVLVERNLHDNLNSFFTKPWQDRIRREEARGVLDKLYIEKFGADDYARLKEFQEWLAEHPQRAMLLAFLQADDPYKI